MAMKHFRYSERLGIYCPNLEVEWEKIHPDEQEAILMQWEKIRGSIPDQIAEIEDRINAKQNELNNEEDFSRSCRLNAEISEHASIINDLWLWFRLHQNVSERMHG
ncbi:hypothetical protein ABEQ24_04175 [Metabacillus idriensis]